MSDTSQADAIRREMTQIRSDIRENVTEIVGTARSMTDWRYYVRRHPWALLAAGGAVGYLIVPRRREPARSPAAPASPGAPGGKPPRGLPEKLLLAAADALARHTVAYVGREAGRWFSGAMGTGGSSHGHQAD